MKALLAILCIALLSGCSYDDAAAFGKAVDSAAYGYYGGRYQQAHPVVAQPVVY